VGFIEYKKVISIIDYGLGNIKAFVSAYRSLGIKYEIINSPEELKLPTHIILPGVGSFDDAMEKIEKKGFKEKLTNLVFEDKVNILGVCIGFQIMGNSSQEGELEGLGWIDVEVKKIGTNNHKEDTMKLPHMGWNRLNVKKECPLLEGVRTEEFYFLHSYNVDEIKNDAISATVNYNSELIAAISFDNIFGTQFHPEKSHKQGLRILKNFSLI